MIPGRLLLNRRTMLAGAAGALGGIAGAEEPLPGRFMAEAVRMRDQAVAAGDQPYGAVLVVDDRIAGFGPSRVIAERNSAAHAERVALWAAQAALGRPRLDGATIYSTSIPCPACQRALAAAGVSRMIHGVEERDAGAPRG